MEFTNAFDRDVGLQENRKKRQMWDGDMSVEHLGLICAPNTLDLPLLRSGWDPILNMVERLRLLPGGMGTRLTAARCYIKPKYTWSAPLVPKVDSRMTTLLAKALIHSTCSWWCVSRFWCQHIDLHPILGSALAVAKSLKSHMRPGIPLLRATVDYHMEKLGVKIRHWDEHTCVVATVSAQADEYLAVAHSVDGASFPFDVCTKRGMHLLLTGSLFGNQSELLTAI